MALKNQAKRDEEKGEGHTSRTPCGPDSFLRTTLRAMLSHPAPDRTGPDCMP